MDEHDHDYKTQQLPDGYKVEMAETKGPQDRWVVELFFKNGYYWVQSREGSKTFQRFYQERSAAWTCYYDRCNRFMVDDIVKK